MLKEVLPAMTLTIVIYEMNEGTHGKVSPFSVSLLAILDLEQYREAE